MVRILAPPPWALTFTLLLLAAPATAQITSEPASPYPDETQFARGLYGEAELGTLMFLADAREQLGFGTALGARVGYDLMRWAAIQVHAFGSTHTTHFGDAPQSGQLLQIYQGTAELKLTIRFGQLAALAFGGAGVARLSTNLLGTTGLTDPEVQEGAVLLGGAGVDYHTLSRHFSFGVLASFARYLAIHAPGAVGLSTYVRYTF